MTTPETAPSQEHSEALATRAQAHRQRFWVKQQWVRLFVAVAVVAAWLAQVLYVTYMVIQEALLLDDVEKLLLVVGVTGIVVERIVSNLWPKGETE